MLIPSDRARSSRRSGVPGVSSPMMIASRRRSSAASAIVRCRTAAPSVTWSGLSIEAEREPHLIRCQTRDTIHPGVSRGFADFEKRTEGRSVRCGRRGDGMTRITRAQIALGLVAAAALVLAATAAARTQASNASPIVIGWAFDSKGAMAPFDGPALAAAQVRVKQINAKGGVGGRPLQINTCDTQGNKPAIAKACATKLLSQGANIIFTTCDVDFAAPVVQETINRGVLAVAPCIGTDQMGPKRFGPKGRLAFSFGNVAQDEGSAMAQYAWGKGWKSASLATDTVIVYFKNVVQAFKARFAQLGGKIVDEETYHSLGGNDVQNAVSRLNSEKADVIV